MSDARSPIIARASSAVRRSYPTQAVPNLLLGTLAAVVAAGAPFSNETLAAPERQQPVAQTQLSAGITLEDAPFIKPIPGWVASAPDIWTRHVYPVAQPPNLQELLNTREPLPIGRTYQIPPADYRRLWLPARSFHSPPWRIPAPIVLAVSFIGIESWVELRPKYATVAKSYTIDFISRLAAGAFITDAAAASVTWSGVDPNGDDLVFGAPTYSGTKVTFQTVGGQAGVIYAVGVAIESSDGTTTQLTGLIPVRSISWP